VRGRCQIGSVRHTCESFRHNCHQNCSCLRVPREIPSFGLFPDPGKVICRAGDWILHSRVPPRKMNNTLGRKRPGSRAESSARSKLTVLIE
jgi:hypothetical protein